MPLLRCFLTLAVMSMGVPACASPAHPGHRNTNTVFQVSTLGALMEGVYDGDITYGGVKKHGDFGLGTFEHLDGEMVAFDGTVYQIRVDGKVYPVPDAMKTPFAVMTFFEADRTLHVEDLLDCTQLQEQIDAVLPTKNIPYAIRVDGDFTYIKARSVPGQGKPYPRLEEVIKQEVLFEFHDTQGTIAGFRFPTYMADLNVRGYHFHFVNAERTAGGHVYDCRVDKVTVAIDDMTEFLMHLPGHGDFYAVTLR